MCILSGSLNEASYNKRALNASKKPGDQECGLPLSAAVRLHTVPPSGLSIGSLSNDDGDVNENGEKAKGLDWQNNNSARASRFFVHFFAFSAMSNFTFCEGREHTTTTFFFVS